MNWKQIVTNLAGATAAGGAVSQIPVPPKYAWIIPVVSLVLGNLAALFQQPPQK